MEEHAATGGTGPSDTAELTLEQYRKIRDLIYQVSGLYFSDKRKHRLENQLSTRLRTLGMRDYEDYYDLLKCDPRMASELSALFDGITISETGFLRDLPQWEALEQEILPQIIGEKNRRREPRLRLWSAGCATGEEVYTSIMVVMELLRERSSQWDVEVLGVDTSEEVLQRAVEGVYSVSATRNMPAQMLGKYFAARGGAYVVRDELRRLARFTPLDLLDHDHMRLIRGMDVVLCRNVLMYFDHASKQQVIADLYDSLNPGGYLLVGATESLHGLSKAFKLVHFRKAIVYRK